MSNQPIPPVVPGISTFRWAVKNPPADPTTSFAGKTILITGPNCGIGFEAATKFARLGASTLIFGVRSLDRGKDAKDLIEKATGCDKNVIRLFQLDMASHESVQAFDKVVSEQFSHIHAAILNAGVSPLSHSLSPDGWEMALQVHVISTTQLALLLLPKLKETTISAGKPSILEIVTSHGYLTRNLEKYKTSGSILEKVNDKANFGMPTQYLTSKLLQMWMTDHIAAKADPGEVIVISCCPGLTRTNIGRDAGMLLRAAISPLSYFCSREAEEGGRTLVSGLLLGPEAHGGFWTNDHLYESGQLVKSAEAKELSDRCWNEVLKVLKDENARF